MEDSQVRCENQKKEDTEFRGVRKKGNRMRETGKRGNYILLGPDSPVKQTLQNALARAGIGEVRSYACAAREHAPAPEDSVLLFGCYDAKGNNADQEWPKALTGAIAQVQKARPRRALLISDLMVYGKVFGRQRLLGEEEIGYICHTSADDAAAQWMRTAEHLCSRLAREESLAVKIVRADWAHILGLLQTEDGPGTILASILDILENGAAGEAYNLSGLTREGLARENAERARTRSPLAPVTVIPDIRKAENYAAS